MARNLYHLLNFIPATERAEMPPALEALAVALVRSGKLRINADTERNFVRIGAHDTDKTVTARELNDLTLRETTRARIAKFVPPAEGEHGIKELWARLQSDLKKARGVSADKEMKVARVLVQSADPAVIQLLLRSGTEVFVSYSHTVGDLMAVHQWESEGTASGMQATESSGTAVYVSAGGDPFFEGEHKHYTTDGFPALARMVVIAGQELGHFADLARTPRGIIGRHSTDPRASALRSNPVASAARLSDMQRTAALAEQYHRAGLAPLTSAERGVAFYHKSMRYTPPWFWYQLRRLFRWILFTSRCKKSGTHLRLHVHPYHRHGDAIAAFISDMAFNLAPDADAYRHPDPRVEEAIAVIEAVARVPQQVHKWGHEAVALAWPALYAFYFNTILPANRAIVGASALPPQTLTRKQAIYVKIRRLLRPKPDYHP